MFVLRDEGAGCKTGELATASIKTKGNNSAINIP